MYSFSYTATETNIFRATMHAFKWAKTYQYIGRNKTSPGASTASKPWACLNFGNFSKSGFSKSTCMRKRWTEFTGAVIGERYSVMTLFNFTHTLAFRNLHTYRTFSSIKWCCMQKMPHLVLLMCFMVFTCYRGLSHLFVISRIASAFWYKIRDFDSEQCHSWTFAVHYDLIQNTWYCCWWKRTLLRQKTCF